MLKNFWGPLAVLECGNYRAKQPSANQFSTWYVLPIFRHFPYFRPHQAKHSVSQFRVFFFNHNSFQQDTKQGQCSTCIKLHDYKLVVKHPKRHSHIPTVRLATVLSHPLTFGPPTARISLHRRDQLRTFYYTAPFFKTERPRQFTLPTLTLSVLASNSTLEFKLRTFITHFYRVNSFFEF